MTPSIIKQVRYACPNAVNMAPLGLEHLSCNDSVLANDSCLSDAV